MHIETERLYIKTPELKQIDDYLIIRNSEGFLKYNPMPPVNRLDAFEELRHQIEQEMILGIFLESQMIGTINTGPDMFRYGIESASLSYALNPAYEGKGYMTEALKAVIHHMFTHEEYVSLSARIFACNNQSRRLIERLGFIQEGYIHQAVKGNDGIIHDDYIYSLLKEAGS